MLPFSGAIDLQFRSRRRRAGRRLARTGRGAVIDTVSAAVRSQIMAGIRGRDTGPEMAVRRALHRRGWRYRLHDRRLPGRPDIVLPRHRAVVLVHGCFWHGHECPMFRLPSSRVDYWRDKIQNNRKRDERNVRALAESGWRVLIVWECAIPKSQPASERERVIDAIERWLTGAGAAGPSRG